MMARDEMPVLKVAQLSWIAGFPDWEMTFSALTSGSDFENQPSMLIDAFGKLDELRRYWLLQLLEVIEDLYCFPV